MNKILLCLALVGFINKVGSQDLSQEKLTQIINNYKSSIETISVIKDCGHVLDGPTYIAKQFENRLLDAVLPISQVQRKNIGSDIFNNMKRTKKIIENHSTKNDVVNIMNKIANGLSVKRVVYKLTLIDAQEINAFTTMGGYLYLTTGLLDFVDSYDELAFIIGHEIAHEEKLHTQRKVTKVLYLSKVLGSVKLDDFKKMAMSLGSSLSAPFDQIDEYEADKYGVFLAKKAGFDVNRFGDFFKKLEKYEKRTLLTKIKSTHPFAKHRKNCIQKYIAN